MPFIYSILLMSKVNSLKKALINSGIHSFDLHFDHDWCCVYCIILREGHLLNVFTCAWGGSFLRGWLFLNGPLQFGTLYSTESGNQMLRTNQDTGNKTVFFNLISHQINCAKSTISPKIRCFSQCIIRPVRSI